ncbi:hypothetical protein ACOMHN_044588 [Nucella lapillus]
MNIQNPKLHIGDYVMQHIPDPVSIRRIIRNAGKGSGLVKPKARNVRAVDRCALKQDLTTRLSSLTSSTLTAATLDSVMTSVLNDHAPATRRKVSASLHCNKADEELFAEGEEGGDDDDHTPLSEWLRDSARFLAADLRMAAFQLDKHTRNISIARVAGGSLALAGGITAIVGFALIPVTFGLSALVAGITGARIAAAGGLAAGGASVAKIFIEKLKKKPLVDRWNQFKEDLRRELLERNPEVYQRMAVDARARIGEAAGNVGVAAGAIRGGAAAAQAGVVAERALAVEAAVAARVAAAWLRLYDIIDGSVDLYKGTGSTAGDYLRQLAAFLDEFARTGQTLEFLASDSL